MILKFINFKGLGLIFYIIFSIHLIVNQCVHSQYLQPEKNKLSPIILIPGDGGCQIEAKWVKPETVHFFCQKVESNWTTLWLIFSELYPLVIKCFVDNMKLVYNATTRTTENAPGVETRIPGFGETNSVEYLDPYSYTHYFVGYYDQIVSYLVKNGYERNKTVRGAPFDFRKAPNELGSYYANLTKLIEDSYNMEKTKVTLIAHSMGAPVLHYYFTKQSQKWKDKYIQAVISLSGAWGGSVKPVKVFAVGDDLGYRFLSSSNIKDLQKSFSSLAFLMPSRDIWDPEEVLVQTPNVNYSLSNIEEYYNALPFEDGLEMYKDTKDLLYKAPPPGVEIHCLHGIGVATIEKIFYKQAKDFPLKPQLFNGDGDGTVNLRSLQYCLQWKEKQSQKIYYETFKKVDHMSILSDPLTLKYIGQYLQEVALQNSFLNESSERPSKNSYRNISSNFIIPVK